MAYAGARKRLLRASREQRAEEQLCYALERMMRRVTRRGWVCTKRWGFTRRPPCLRGCRAVPALGRLCIHRGAPTLLTQCRPPASWGEHPASE
jgi:hypothetical protein